MPIIEKIELAKSKYETQLKKLQEYAVSGREEADSPDVRP